jgi:hypothetical protein
MLIIVIEILQEMKLLLHIQEFHVYFLQNCPVQLSPHRSYTLDLASHDFLFPLIKDCLKALGDAVDVYKHELAAVSHNMPLISVLAQKDEYIN